MTPTNVPKPSKAQRTAQARERDRRLREDRARKEKRSSFLIRWGVVAAVVAILVTIGLIVAGNIRDEVPDAGPAPAHGNEYGGITLASSTELVETGAETVDLATLPEEPRNPADPPPGVGASAAGDPVQVVVYVDVNCVFCAEFERTYSDRLGTWLDAGDITLEYRNVAYLDTNSSTDYSSRGANALACVADTSPEHYFDFVNAVFGNFENGELDDEGLATMASDVAAGDISGCVSEGTFRPYVKYTSQAAEIDGVNGTPTVYVDGEEVLEPVTDFATVLEEKIAAKG